MGALAAIMLLLTMFSRNYLGVHTPQDVVVGAMLGLVVVFMGSFAWEWIDKKPVREWVIPAAGAVLTALFLVYISLKSYPMDYDANGKLLVDPVKMTNDGYKDAGRFLGVCLGWFAERRLIKFSVDVPTRRKVNRCVVGVLLILLYELAFMPAVTNAVSAGWVSFLLTFAELIILTFVYPLCFTLAEKGLAKKADSGVR